jgi:hypothetical protein
MKNFLDKMSLFLVLLAGLFAVEVAAARRVDNELRSEVCLNGTWDLKVAGETFAEDLLAADSVRVWNG